MGNYFPSNVDDSFFMYAASFFIVVFVLPKEKEERKRVITLAKMKQNMAARGSWTRAPFFGHLIKC